MTTIGYMASQVHYLRHLRPIIDRLRAEGVTVEPATRPGTHDAVLVAGRQDAERAQRTPNPPSRVMLVEHGSGQMYQTDRGLIDGGGGRIDETVTLFLAPSQRCADSMVRFFPNAEMAVVGSPAVERLADQIRQRNGRWYGEIQADGIELASNPLAPVWTTHWTSPLYGLAREAGTSWPWSINILWNMSDEWPDTIAHGHPKLQRKIHYHAGTRSVRTAADWDRVALETAVLVADNTSVMWEALTVGIPVVAMTPPYWSDDAPHGFPRFGPNRIALPTIHDPWETVGVVGDAMDWAPPDPGVYDIVDGATGAAVRAIVDHVGLKPAQIVAGWWNAVIMPIRLKDGS